LAIVATYLPDLGRGFIKDDFAWIAGSRTEGGAGWLELFRRHNGFYRPLVSLTFAVNERLAGQEPFWFGLTNLLLVLACVLAIFALCRSLGLTFEASALAAAAWGLNPHGVGGSVMWISGRTSLLATLFAVLAAVFLLRRHLVAAWLSSFLALSSKEEATLLPLVLAVWQVALSPGSRLQRWRCGLRTLAVLSTAAAGYLVLRAQTGAFLPWTAPAYYRFTLSPRDVVRNVLEYADRSATFSVIVAVGALAVLQRWPRISPARRPLLLAGCVWCAGGFAPTILLPVRSSLYVLLPSVGVVMVLGVLFEALWLHSSSGQRRRFGALAAVVILGLIPVLRSRNTRLRRQAELSSHVLAQLEGVREQLQSGSTLVLVDQPSTRINLAGTFGTLIQEAVRLRLSLATARVWLEPPLPDAGAAGLAPPDRHPVVRLRLIEGRLIPD
jgi:hypothetical protein